jgi:predicted dehydrogenase
MVRAERPDAVVIASPSSTHYEYLLKCIDSELHIFCEKPFIWNGHKDLRKMVEEMFEKALRKKLTIAMNSQWSFSIDAYEAICGKIVIQKSNTFFIKMSPPYPGREMISESVPHAISLLYGLLGAGEIEELHFESEGEKEMSIRFVYLFGTEVCKGLIRLTFQETMPRDFSFGLNDKIVFRSLDLENYEIYFNYGDKKLRIIDPLELSVKNFMEAVEKETEPFIGMLHILHNMSLLKEIDDGFGEFEKRNLWKS